MLRFAAALQDTLACARPQVVALGGGHYRVQVEIPAPERVSGEQVAVLSHLVTPAWRWSSSARADGPLVMRFDLEG
ncbi:hypothetical protein ABT095_17375 [Kitasatospora sp. NPDC002227]|uniref:hypothetical protein n=1 Tax=Kitasatospora sp. NPDC002227 TaxID=3154773 RepID=UPI003332C067